MYLNLKHPFTLIVAWPSSCGKSTFVIRLLECREPLCDIAFENTVCCHSENNALHHLKKVSLVKGVSDFEIPESIPTLIVLDDLMDNAYSTKASQSFTKGSHQRNISLVLITQILFHQGPSSRDIYLNSNYIVVFKNPRAKTQIVQLSHKYTFKVLLLFTRRTSKCVNILMPIFY